jgi:hypothetical protein
LAIHHLKGPPKEETNRGPLWWVGGSEAKKIPGPEAQNKCIFVCCFRTPLTEKRETPKNAIKNNREKNLGFLFLFLLLIFRCGLSLKGFFHQGGGGSFPLQVVGLETLCVFFNSHR